MTSPSAPNVPPREVVRILKTHYVLWMVPAVICLLAGLVYGFIRPLTWRASQALVVRDEVSGTLARPGRFDSSEAMKTAQETIVQMSKNQAVVAAALTAVGPPDDRAASSEWPSEHDIARLQAAITVTAPKGAEFGRTEVIYLSVLAGARERAIQLTTAVCDRLEERLQELRDRRATSMMTELTKSVDLARADLDEATRALETLEREVGGDLVELRSLTEPAAGDGKLAAALNQIKVELRQIRTIREANAEQRNLLVAARENTSRLLVAPNRLFESQPSLRRLKDGLVDAQLRTAQLLSKMSSEHPEVVSAGIVEQEVRDQLSRELEAAIGGFEADLKVSDAQIQSLERQVADDDARLGRLVGMRARYANLTSEVRQSSETLTKAERDLADARASRAAAQSTSLITRMDSPETEAGPVGPGKAVIALGGGVLGLILGLGLVFVCVPIAQLRGRRRSDPNSGGRRADDPTIAAAETNPPAREPVPTAARRTAEPPPTTGRETVPMPSVRPDRGLTPTAPDKDHEQQLLRHLAGRK